MQGPLRVRSRHAPRCGVLTGRHRAALKHRVFVMVTAISPGEDRADETGDNFCSQTRYATICIEMGASPEEIFSLELYEMPTIIPETTPTTERAPPMPDISRELLATLSALRLSRSPLHAVQATDAPYAAVARVRPSVP